MNRVVRVILGVILSFIGGVIGAAVGIALFKWLFDQGFYAMILPGACLGLGVHLASLEQSQARGIVSSIAALATAILTEGWFRPFNKDNSLAYFFQNIPSLSGATFLMIAVGGIFGYWWGKQASPWAPKTMKPLKVKERVEGVKD